MLGETGGESVDSPLFESVTTAKRSRQDVDRYLRIERALVNRERKLGFDFEVSTTEGDKPVIVTREELFDWGRFDLLVDFYERHLVLKP